MAVIWRCLACGALYEARFAFCSGCWAQGQIVPQPRRLSAEVDSLPGEASARDIARMNWQQVPHEVYAELVVGQGALVEVSGQPGAGKSSFACRLLDSIPGTVVLVSAEEGLSPSLSARLSRCRVARGDFRVLTRASVDAVVARTVELKAVALCVDSVSEVAWSASELRHILEVIPTLAVLIAVLQVTKQGLPSGANALLHEADVHVSVESMRWSLKKSRYQDLAAVGGDVLSQAAPEVENAAP